MSKEDAIEVMRWCRASPAMFRVSWRIAQVWRMFPADAQDFIRILPGDKVAVELAYTESRRIVYGNNRFLSGSWDHEA